MPFMPLTVMEKTESSAVSGVPSDHFSPSLRRKVMTVRFISTDSVTLV